MDATFKIIVEIASDIIAGAAILGLIVGFTGLICHIIIKRAERD